MSLVRDQLTAQVFELAVPPAPESVSVSRLFVAAVARHHAIGEEMVGDLKVAVSEAVTNSIKAHRVAERAHLQVLVRVRCDEQSCTVEVTDQGGGFEHPSIDGTLTPPSGLYEGSLGLLLIRALFPEAEIASNDLSGTTVRFVAHR